MKLITSKKCIIFVGLLLPCIALAKVDKTAQPPIIVNVSKPTAIIKLQSNPTTGYSWLLQNYDHALMILVSHDFETSKTKLMGASGIETWAFKLKPEAFLAPQLIKVNFLNTRLWDLSNGTEKTVNIITQNIPVKKGTE